MSEMMYFNSFKQLCEIYTLTASRLEIDRLCTRAAVFFISCSSSNILFILAGLGSKSLLDRSMARNALFFAPAPKWVRFEAHRLKQGLIECWPCDFTLKAGSPSFFKIIMTAWPWNDQNSPQCAFSRNWMAAKSKVDFFEVLGASPSISRDHDHLVPISVFWGQVADFRDF